MTAAGWVVVGLAAWMIVAVIVGNIIGRHLQRTACEVTPLSDRVRAF
jgi:uncharacterized membrane protein YfcA